MALIRDVKMLGRAVRMAETSTYRWQHGCVLAQGNRVMAMSSNRFRNNPVIAPKDVSTHAEDAVLKGSYRQGR